MFGSDLSKRETALGFSAKSNEAQTDDSAYERMKEKVLEEVKRFFRPEFLNRIDSTVVFHQLTKPEILQIVDLMMNQVRDELGEKDIDMEVTDAATSARTGSTLFWALGHYGDLFKMRSKTDCPTKS